ncbi:MAG: AraC family transcriptional regulator [Myxococcales bacterium]|nr:AraC family transcriptional regulator [Myxococcales bacterium]
MSSNRFRRYHLGRSLFVWSYELGRESHLPRCPSFGLEIGITISGTRTFDSAAYGPERFESGRVSVFGLDEPYALHYAPGAEGRGHEIGIVVRGDRLSSWLPHKDRVRFVRRDEARTDPRMRALGCRLASCIARRQHPAALGDAVAVELADFIARYAETVPADPLERARLELVRHFQRQLYMRSFAEIAGVNEETFARKFSARYGVTPTRYRVLLRLKEAAVLLVTRAHRTVHEISAAAGFEDPAYFYRSFHAHFGTTPLGFARRFGDTPSAFIAA